MTSRISLTLAGAIMSVTALLPQQTLADTIKSATVRFGTTSYNADWYLPTRQPDGIVYLQHGFPRDKKNLKELGTHLMQQGLMVLAIKAGMTGGAPSLAPNVATAFRSRTLTPPNGYSLPSSLVLAGHSAGGLHVTLVGKSLVESGFTGLKGVVLFDPVDANNLFKTAAQTVVDSGKPLRAVLANGGSCNSNNNTEAPLRGLTGISFVGFKLTNRSAHTDAEGSSSDWLGRLFCGTPQAYNTNYLKQAAGAWAKDMVNGTVTADYYPGGSFVQGLLNTNNAYLIK